VKLLLPLIEDIYKSKPISPDFLIDDGESFERIGIKATCIHTPGHTAGSCSLFFESGDIFVGDLISSTGNPHIQRYFAINWSDVSKSVVKVKNLNPNRIFPGHGTYVINGEELASL
jgi:glyoxylase-like metal-dependent hydrolase (beta-lactamase superfamily II)